MKFRSPKWLRNIIDFEISTGKDINGIPSNRAIRRAVRKREKERKKRLRQEKILLQEKKDKWDERWENKDNNTFSSFYLNNYRISINPYKKEELENLRGRLNYNDSIWDEYDKYLEKIRLEYEEKKRQRNLLNKKWMDRWNYTDRGYGSIFIDFYYNTYKKYRENDDDILKKWKYDWTLWNEFDKYITRKKEREINRENQERKINKILSDISYDWYKNNDEGKVKTIGYTTITFKYTMDDGTKYTFRNNILIVETYESKVTWTLGLLYKSNFIKLFNRIVDDINKGRSKSKRSSSSSYKNTGSSKSSNHPKKGLYDSLMNTILQREQQLKNMKKNDPNRISMENELKVAKNKAENIKTKYQL